MVDFTKLLEEMRNEKPGDRERRLAEQEERFRIQTQERLDKLRAQVQKASQLVTLTTDDRRFLSSLERMAQRDEPFTRLVGGELLSLTERQLTWLQQLAQRAEVTQPAPGSRAHRYGRQRG